jgi:hypothetical protein
LEENKGMGVTRIVAKETHTHKHFTKTLKRREGIKRNSCNLTIYSPLPRRKEVFFTFFRGKALTPWSTLVVK